MNISNQHPFDMATSTRCIENNVFVGATSPDYANIVGTFGGITAATLLRTVLEHDERHGDPVAQTVNFCGSISEGEFQISTEVQRQGKYTQHWSLSLVQDDVVKATSSIVCGIRTDVFSHQVLEFPSVRDPDQCEPLETKKLINWLERFSFKFIEGRPILTGIPLAETGSSRSLLWISDLPARGVDMLTLTTYADCFFPRLLHLRGKMVPFGTVSMTTYFHAGIDDLSAIGNDPLLGVTDAQRLHQNFHDQQMQLWTSDGSLLATGSQLVWYKE